jgi:uncharacterized membrane protein
MKDAGYFAFGVAIGSAALFVGLVTMLVGFVPIAIGAGYVWRDAGTHRLTFIGGSMVGIGLAAWPTLGQAVTNHDPAVRYDPSTVPVLIAGLVVGAIGMLLVIIGTMRAHSLSPA